MKDYIGHILICLLLIVISYYIGFCVGEGKQYVKEQRYIDCIKSQLEMQVKYDRRMYELEDQIRKNNG